MGEVLISVENVSKKFCRDLKRGLWYGLKDMGSELLGTRGQRIALREKEFWAVRDVNFEVRRGECLGLVGRNGAGKSTLLKMLNGLIKPDEGRIQMNGRVGALIELGAGFNPVLTGKENIYVNGSILGLTKKEIDGKLNSIIQFSEMEEFMNTPVRYYSSGMKVRLGFAIAAQMEPEILLVDEVLAVGDMGFVLKCFNRMDSLLKNTAIILVSHNIPQIARMSTNLLVMQKGKSVYNSANISEGLTKYYESFENETGSFEGTEKVKIRKIALSSNGNTSADRKPITIEYGQELRVIVELECTEKVFKPNMWLSFYDKEQRVFAEVRNFNQELSVDYIEGVVELQAVLPKVEFAQGNYSITIGLMEELNGARQTLFRYQSAIYFNVHGKLHGWAPVQFESVWNLNGKNQ